MSDSIFPDLPISASLHIFVEDVDFIAPNESVLKNWVLKICDHHQSKLGTLNYIFCSDQYLHKINLKYLQHDTFTDIITFASLPPPIVAGDVFISIPRVKENALKFQTSFENELHRVLAHGVLHLIGFGDKSEKEAAKMRSLEEEALQFL